MILLGHGASGGPASMKPYVEGLGRRGVDAATVPSTGKLPMRAEKAAEVFRAMLLEHPGAIVGGHSYGGRVASMVVAAADGVPGLVLFSYPLHRPGRPEDLRTGHWPSIKCPVLLLSGESDPFARVELLRKSVKLLPRAELVTYPGVGHGLARSPKDLDDALDRVAQFARRVG
jgi:predicted alpha/beta-hydrolase family hydrolase